jgi:hypothetical protein
VNALIGSSTGLMVMFLAALLVVVIVLAVNFWLRWQRLRIQRADVQPNTVEAAPAYRRYVAAAAWAGGSRRNWDYSVRPVLAELVELAIAEQHPAGGDPREITRRWMGPELWPLVDRDAPRSDDLERPGPDRDALLKILERVEHGER